MSNFDNHNITQDCSVIIPVYRRYAIVKTILESLSKQTKVKNIKEIIICDSEKDDDNMKIVIESCRTLFVNSTIKHVFVENNLSAKRNAGIIQANSDNLIFIDDDCVPEQNFISNHLGMLKDSYNALFCGIVEFNKNKLKISNYTKFRNSRHERINLYNKNEHSENAETSENMNFINFVAMNMSCKKKLLTDKNLFFDKDFLGYGGEDTEFGCRAQICGVSIKKCSAKIIHEEIGDFDLFCKKIYHVSRDGMPKLISKQNEAFWTIPFTKYLESGYPYHQITGKFASWIIRNLIINRTALLIKYFLIKTDKLNFLYFSILYKYVMAYYHIKGVHNRDNRFHSNNETRNGFLK
jgi:glycosyltransferase involved in cell wall biosynthesis